MLLRYWTIGIRNMVRHKVISCIELFGLALGMAVGLIVIAVIKEQFSFDDFHPYPERTVRIATDVTSATGDHGHYATSPFPLGAALKQNDDFIEEVLRIYPSIHSTVKVNSDNLSVNGAFADASFFQIFGFKLSAGNPAKALRDPFSIVITDETAQRFFGQDDPLGKVLAIEDLGEFVVTGVMENERTDAHIQYPIYASMSTVPMLNVSKIKDVSARWEAYDDAYTYVLLRSETDSERLNDILPIVAKAAKTTFLQAAEFELQFKAQFLTDIVPSSRVLEPGNGKSVQSLVFLSAIAFVILLIAGFNYANLSIARSFGRSREIGIRRIKGASSAHIFWQFITEAMIRALLALPLAYVFMKVMPLNDVQQNAVQNIETDVPLIGYFLSFTMLVSVMVGAFPSFVLSRVKPLQAVGNLLHNALPGGVGLQKIFIILQFTFSMVFIIVLLVLYQQVQYMKDADYGFDRKNIVSIPLKGADHDLLSGMIAQHSNVLRVSATSANFGLGHAGKHCTGKIAAGDAPVSLDYFSVDQNQPRNMHLEFIAGDNFPSTLSDLNEAFAILNETAVRKLGLGTPAEAVGKQLIIDDTVFVRINGVLKDFHYRSFKHSIGGMVLRYKPDEFRYLNVKVIDAGLDVFFTHLENTWRKANPSNPLEYQDLERNFSERQSYRKDMVMIGSLSLMTVLIACIGLLGAVMYEMEKRVREIGIRKVLGASAWSVLVLLNRKFLKLLLVAGVLAAPVGYYIATQFLKKFTYKTPMGAAVILTSVAIILLTGMVIVSTQAIRTAFANPARILKTD